MRIGIFIDTENYGGAESIVISIVSFLARTSHQPVIYHFGNPYLERACAELNVQCRTVSHWRAYKRTYRLPSFAYHFARMLKSDNVDLLHSHLFGPIIAGGLACRLANIPHVGTLHDVYIVQERPIRAKLLKLVHWLGTRLVCVSEQMAEYYASVTAIGSRDLRVIRNGVDLDRYGIACREPGEDESLELIMVGRLDAIKRHKLMIETLSGLSDLPRWRASIVGDGPEGDALQDLCGALGLESRISFLGLRDDVPELLAGADIFLLVSDSEGMSLSLIEAIASGLPIIATKVGNNSELVTDGWNGLLINPGSRAELEKAVQTLLGNDELRREFGSNSRSLSRGLDLQIALSSYLKLYEEVVSAV